MAEIAIAGVVKEYPNGYRAIRGLDLDVADGEFTVLVGPSGCGKSTLLRMVCGLEDVTAGSVTIDGRDVTDAAPRSRDIAMVFQSYALYPHMNVRRNIGYPLKLARVPRAEIDERVAAVARRLGLEEVLERRPSQLSGGQRQRVAMGRAIVREPTAFLMDEPLSNLDANLRVQMRAEIASLQRDLGVTTLYVTHDQVEAMTMGDRVAVLNEGVLEQCATPRELYDAPANLFVAHFIGSPAINLFTSRLNAGNGGTTVQLAGCAIDVCERHRAALGDLGVDTEIVVGVRPEAFEAVDTEGATVTMRASFVEELGAEHVVHGTLVGDPARQPCTVRLSIDHTPVPGDLVPLRMQHERLLLFDASTGRRLGGGLDGR